MQAPHAFISAKRTLLYNKKPYLPASFFKQNCKQKLRKALLTLSFAMAGGCFKTSFTVCITVSVLMTLIERTSSTSKSCSSLAAGITWITYHCIYICVYISLLRGLSKDFSSPLIIYQVKFIFFITHAHYFLKII